MTQEAQPSKEAMEAAKKIADAQNDRGRNYDNGYSEDEIAAIIDASHSGLREELERAKQDLKATKDHHVQRGSDSLETAQAERTVVSGNGVADEPRPHGAPISESTVARLEAENAAMKKRLEGK